MSILWTIAGILGAFVLVLSLVLIVMTKVVNGMADDEVRND